MGEALVIVHGENPPVQSFVEEDYVIANVIPAPQAYNKGLNWTNYIYTFTGTFHQPFDFSGLTRPNNPWRSAQMSSCGR